LPTYDYRCKACGHALEIFHSISEAPRRKCPKCGKLALERQIGTGAGILFRGSGFYQTDYRSDSYRKDASSDKAETGSQAAEPGGKKDATSTPADAGGTSSSPSAPAPKPKGRPKKDAD
jgi:putative FmdB family regulatory protein